MKISKVIIKNFRSIENADFDCNDFNIFVGQNNSGKTNFFEAIEWFFNGLPKGKSIQVLHPKGDMTKEISVKIQFTGAIHGAENMRNETRLNIEPDNWLIMTKQFTKVFHGAVGNEHVLQNFSENLQLKRRPNLSSCRRLLA
jgi:AAA15 family ATPase/GTPase